MGWATGCTGCAVAQQTCVMSRSLLNWKYIIMSHAAPTNGNFLKTKLRSSMI